MSRQEIYAWAGLASALAIAGYYILAVIGLPEAVEPLAGRLGSILIRVILITAGVELVLDLAQSFSALRVDKDERDRLIEGKSFRNAYYVLMAVVFAAIGHLVVTGFLGNYLSENEMALSFRPLTLHMLVLGFLLASAVNSGSRLYCYWRGS